VTIPADLPMALIALPAAGPGPANRPPGPRPPVTAAGPLVAWARGAATSSGLAAVARWQPQPESRRLGASR
jgi:hypothetical protein